MRSRPRSPLMQTPTGLPSPPRPEPGRTRAADEEPTARLMVAITASAHRMTSSRAGGRAIAGPAARCLRPRCRVGRLPISAAAVATRTVVTPSAASSARAAFISRRLTPRPCRSSRTAMFLTSAWPGWPVSVSCRCPSISGWQAFPSGVDRRNRARARCRGWVPDRRRTCKPETTGPAPGSQLPSETSAGSTASSSIPNSWSRPISPYSCAWSRTSPVSTVRLGACSTVIPSNADSKFSLSQPRRTMRYLLAAMVRPCAAAPGRWPRRR
jgi:hypothetical protein